MPRFIPLVLLFTLSAFGDSADPSRWTVDDVILAPTDTDFRVAPDGNAVVWVHSEVDPEKGRFATLMRASLTNDRKTQLTRGKFETASPRWSPDGRYIAFLSNRPDPDAKPATKNKSRRGKRGDKDDEPVTQLWLLDTDGGEPRALTTGEHPVSSFDWAGKDAIVILAREDATEREARLKDEKDTSNVVEDDPNFVPSRLFRVEIEKGKITRLTQNRDSIDLMATSPDGKFALAVHSQALRYTYDNRKKPITRLHDLTTGTSEKFADPEIVPSAFVWSPDGKGCYVLYDRSSQMEFNQAGITHVRWFDPATKKAEEIPLDWPRGLTGQACNPGQPGLVAIEGGFLAQLADGARPKVARYGKADGWKRSAIDEPNVYGIAADRTGRRAVFARSSASRPTQWFHADLAGTALQKSKALTEVPEALAAKKKAKAEVAHWKGANGDPVEGILYYPHDHVEGKRYPLIVAIHGGPAGADYDIWEETWAYSSNLYAQRGAFVLKPNYHGSSDYGPEWLESITRGKYCDLEPIDIDNGVNHLIARGLVDPDKLGILGWSNGGILTSLITTQTSRYKAAASGAGTIEYISDWANCEFGDAFDRFYLGKSALEDFDFYKRKSPFFSMNKVATPTLILFGSEDRVVPTQQGWMHYRALQQVGKTPVKFVLFPGEGHGLKQIGHQRRKLTEELAWFDQHLFKTATTVATSIKKDSPLAALLAKGKAEMTVEGKYGSTVAGVMVPEVVRYQGIEVGRFEVTRAQFAQFEPKTLVVIGMENTPMVATSEQARAYCEWLSKKTGQTVRLPSAEEAEKLYPEEGEGENVLDYWAGYAVNPDDAARILGEVKAIWLGRPVGSFKGVGEPMVFDLGGNLAEWVVGEDGKATLRGGSADRPSDPKARGEAGAGYRGFRVVRVKK